jgi:hypothetical protein
LAKSLVLGQNHLLGRIAVLGFETEPLAGFGIDAVKGAPAFAAVDQSETELHKHWAA